MRVYSLLVATAILLFSCSKGQTQQHQPVSCTAISTANIHGVNWADVRDNYVDGWVIPSGLNTNDDYATTQAKAGLILKGFKDTVGANTVRLPINPQTVLQSWWNSYTGAIDKALSSNMTVILACWEGAAHKDGMIDDTTQFWSMWNVVVAKYKDVDNVYFEVFNEPFGYSVDAWKSICKQWLAKYNYIPRCRVLIGGISYDDYVVIMGADTSFNNCLLSQHIYPWWAPVNTPTDWASALKGRIGAYANRTILTEFGAPMTTGLNYTGAANGDVNISFIQGINQQVAAFNMGSCYWPGLRDGDSYSILTLRNDSIINNNPSGIKQLHTGWHIQ